MSELRKNPVTEQWVIVIPERGIPPREFDETPNCDIAPDVCPMAAGNERMTCQEVFSIRDSGEPDKPGWQVRVVPNKFPALSPDAALQSRSNGFFESLSGMGIDEIVIETPDHGEDLALAPDEQIMRVIASYIERVQDLYRDENLRQIIIYRNHKREAGMTLTHPHSQLMGLPAIPSVMQQKLRGAAGYYADERSCIFCDIIDWELQQDERVILTTDHFIAIAGYACQFPYGAEIYPLEHSHTITTMTPQQRADLAGMLRRLMCAYRVALFDPPYNMVWQIAPNVPSDQSYPAYCDDIESHYHWHIQIHPRLTTIAGFESGTGLYVNPVAPEKAAEHLTEELS